MPLAHTGTLTDKQTNAQSAYVTGSLAHTWSTESCSTRRHTHTHTHKHTHAQTQTVDQCHCTRYDPQICDWHICMIYWYTRISGNVYWCKWHKRGWSTPMAAYSRTTGATGNKCMPTNVPFTVVLASEQPRSSHQLLPSSVHLFS